MKLDEAGHALGIDQAEGMHAKAFHHSKAARDGAVRHGPHDHMGRLRHQRDEIPEGVMSRTAGRYLVVGLWLHRVDKIGELDGILDEKHRHVVADQVEIAFICIELDGKAPHISHRVARTAWALNRREADKNRGDLFRILQETGLGQLSVVAIALEEPMCPGTAGVHDALGDTLMVKVGDFLAHDEVFK
ncbi:hypothetical protein D3C80_913910 [compost metagenome]